MKRPLRVESVKSKRGNLSIRLVDANDEIVLDGFGYFQEKTLRTLAAAVNAVKASDQRLMLKQLEWSDFAKEKGYDK